MPFQVEAKMQGVDELIQRLEGLKQTTRGTILRSAVTKSSRVVLKRAKARAPRGLTGLLKRSLAFKVVTYKSGVTVGIIGPDKGYRLKKSPVAGVKKKVKVLTKLGQKYKDLEQNPVYYAHLVELGTKRTTAKPFLRPALEESKAEIRAIFAEEIQKGLEKIAVRGK